MYSQADLSGSDEPGTHSRLLRKSRKAPGPKPKKKRYTRWCPVPGCTAKPQKRLSNHIPTQHPELSAAQRKVAYQNALRYVKPSLNALKASGPMDSFFKAEVPEEEEEKPPSPSPVIKYTVSEQPTLQLFNDWLQTPDGKSKSKTTALQEVTDTSKFLHFDKPKGSPIEWDDITSRMKLRTYVETLKQCGLQASGIIQKLTWRTH